MTYESVSKERYTDTSTMIKFKLNGRESLVVRPDKPLPGNPTVWRTEFFSAFNFADKALLERGWHLCYHSVSDMYGNPESLVKLHEFYEFAAETFGLSEKPVLFGFSRGGLYAVNYAAQYPDEVGGLYLDAPVLDIRDWPCRENLRGNREYRQCLDRYGLTPETLDSFELIPLNRAEAVAHLPIIIVAGLVDTVVLWEKNGEPFAKKLKALGVTHKVIVKPDCDHHPHSLEEPAEIVEFIEAHCL